MKVATVSGAVVDLNAPHKDDIRLQDVGHALANICRFNGHTSRFYSVAEHSMIGAMLTDDPRVKLGFLLHDAAEAFTGDIVSPIKGVMGSTFAEIEQRLQAHVCVALGGRKWARWDSGAVKVIDRVMLYAEAAELMPEGSIDLPAWPEQAGTIALARHYISEASPAAYFGYSGGGVANAWAQSVLTLVGRVRE